MRLGFFLFVISGVLIYNIYYDSKPYDFIKKNIKSIKIAGILFSAYTIYLFFKKFPSDSSKMMKHLHGMIKYMPIDKNSKDMITPIMDLTKNTSIFGNEEKMQIYNELTPQMKRMLNSGGNNGNKKMKRSVSETKKKYVASQQKWSCGHCSQQLDATFEVDHIVELQNGGSNEISNLVALCRNCHGKKSMITRLQ